MELTAQIRELTRGTVDFISPEELKKKMERGKPLRVKLGFDPTMKDLHLGHTVVMQKLKQFQDIGHQVIFLIGDETARVGDPSGQSKTRPTLTTKEVKANAKTYLDQAFKILDKKKTKVRRNSEWLGKMKPADFYRLAGHYNVARMLERDDFKKRHQEETSISILEFLYPLMQGYDSVALKADVEIGGSDQKFNLTVARNIQRAYGQEPEVIITLPLLVGTDGVKKMSKSYGNTIGVTESPKTMFGKIMSVSDERMWHYYELLTDVPLTEVKTQHPKEAKIRLGKIIVRRFHSEKEAEAAAQEFEKVFVAKQKPSDIPVFKAKGGAAGLLELLVVSGLAASKGEARRLIQQKGVRLNDETVTDIHLALPTDRSAIIQVGKRKFMKVEF